MTPKFLLPIGQSHHGGLRELARVLVGATVYTENLSSAILQTSNNTMPLHSSHELLQSFLGGQRRTERLCLIFTIGSSSFRTWHAVFFNAKSQNKNSKIAESDHGHCTPTTNAALMVWLSSLIYLKESFQSMHR